MPYIPSLLISSNFYASLLDMKIWYGLPLVVAVSLVYAATRHEDMRPIFRHAARTGLCILAFFAVFFALLYALGVWL